MLPACLLDNRIRWKCQYVVNVDQNSDKKYQGKSRTFSFKIMPIVQLTFVILCCFYYKCKIKQFSPLAL